MTASSPDKIHIEKALLKLNGFLSVEPLDKRKFSATIRQFCRTWNLKISILDFHYFDEKRLNKARHMKLKAWQLKSYEYAVNLDQLEKICLKYIEIKQLFHLHQSVFLLEDNYLLFCHFATSVNNSHIITTLLKNKNYVRLNIK